MHRRRRRPMLGLDSSPGVLISCTARDSQVSMCSCGLNSWSTAAEISPVIVLRETLKNFPSCRNAQAASGATLSSEAEDKF